MINPIYFQTKTKMINSSISGAPTIINAYGTLEAFLNTTLCTGFNLQKAIKVEVLEDKIKIYLETPTHSYITDQVISLSGAVETPYNREYRIYKTSSEYITVLLSESDTPKLLTTLTNFQVKIAPLGFTRVFTKATTTGITSCFKNSSKTSPAILKVIDDLPPNSFVNGWARYARVVAGQEIDAFGDFINDRKVPYHPDYPDAENTGNGVSGASGIHGFAKWDYAPSSDSYNRENYTGNTGSFPRKWTLIGDDNTFYLILDSHGDGYPTILTFGLFYSYNRQETFNIVLSAQDNFTPSNSTTLYQWYSRKGNAFGTVGETSGNFLFCNAYGGGTYTTSRYRVGGLFFGNNNRHLTHFTDRVINYNPQSGKVVTSRLLIVDADTGVLRGYNRGLRIFYGIPDITINKVTEDGEIILEANEYSTTKRRAPYLFSLLDWEV